MLRSSAFMSDVPFGWCAAFVRVRPAFVGEGRYFVRVPPGTNAGNYELQKPRSVDETSLEAGVDAEDGLNEVERTNMFLQFLADQEAGYDGTFGGR